MSGIGTLSPVPNMSADAICLGYWSTVEAEKMFFVPIAIPGPVFMLGYLLIAVVLILQKHRGGVSHEGHLGGALIGLAVTGLLAPNGLDPLVAWLRQWV